jgi:hypothetical protein
MVLLLDVYLAYTVVDSCQRASAGDDASRVMRGCSLTLLLWLVARRGGSCHGGEVPSTVPSVGPQSREPFTYSFVPS